MCIWNGRIYRLCFRQLFVVKKDFCWCPVDHTGQRTLLYLVLAAGIKTVCGVWAFQILSPICKTQTGKETFASNSYLYEPQSARSEECIQTMGAQCVSPLLYCPNVSYVCGACRQRGGEDALEIFKYFGKIGPEDYSSYLKYLPELCGRKLRWLGFDG